MVSQKKKTFAHFGLGWFSIEDITWVAAFAWVEYCLGKGGRFAGYYLRWNLDFVTIVAFAFIWGGFVWGCEEGVYETLFPLNHALNMGYIPH